MAGTGHGGEACSAAAAHDGRKITASEGRTAVNNRSNGGNEPLTSCVAQRPPKYAAVQFRAERWLTAAPGRGTTSKNLQGTQQIAFGNTKGDPMASRFESWGLHLGCNAVAGCLSAADMQSLVVATPSHGASSGFCARCSVFQRVFRLSRKEGGMTVRIREILAALALVAGLVVGVGLRPVHAACNLIPGTAKTFNGILGATNRPFAAPGESLEVRVRPCDTTSPGLTATAADQVVTVVFTPPAGSRHAVVLTADADCAMRIDPQLAACAAQLTGGGTATCVPAVASGLEIVDRDGVRHLRFRFPDTDALLAPDGDDLTLSGPATIAVSAATAPLPCQLAKATCATAAGLIACVDALFANDGACGTAVPDTTFPHFTALPPPNDFQADCFEEDPLLETVTVAVRLPPVRRDISPTTSPGPKRLISRFWPVPPHTSSSPLTTTKNRSPASPSLQTVAPLGNGTSSNWCGETLFSGFARGELGGTDARR